MADDDLAALTEYLHDQTCRLEDLSLAFCRRWAQRNERQWGLVSLNAFAVIADIVEKMLPAARARMNTASQAARSNWTTLDRDTAIWSAPISQSTQLEQMFALPLGSGVLPETPQKVDISLLETLECLSRMQSARVNFRLEGGRHIVQFGIDSKGSATPGIMELDIGRFCELLLVGIEEL